jgi:hypothetical protein
MAQTSKSKTKSRKSRSKKGAAGLLEDTLTKLNSLTKEAETTLNKVRRAVKDVSKNVASGAGDLAAQLPVVGHPKKSKARTRKPSTGSKKRAGGKSTASSRPSAEKKSSAGTGKSSASESKGTTAGRSAASRAKADSKA